MPSLANEVILTPRLEGIFWERAGRGEPGECWPWQGHITRYGYGKFGRFMAHRISVAIDGRDPAGMSVDHTCRNRRCVNPHHLRVVDHRTNALENSAAPPAQNAGKTHCVHGHEFTPENTYIFMRAGAMRRNCRQCRRIMTLAYYYRTRAMQAASLAGQPGDEDG